MNGAPGVYCFTLDDNIRFFEQAARAGLPSVFAHPYPALLLRLHQAYGTKFQLNMYESYAPGLFSLAEAPDRWRGELEANADWLRFSFHARHNDPPFPYENAAPETLLADYRAVMGQLRRIAGRAATDATTTLHYVCAGKAACTALRGEGVRGLIGMFYPLPGREALRYYLTPAQAQLLQRQPLWRDTKTGLTFACNDLVLNAVSLPEIVPRLEARRKNFYHVMIHEQYFYQDYEAYQPDFAQKVEAALDWFRGQGLRSCFLEELIPEESTDGKDRL